MTGIPIPGISRENQFNVFPLDLQKSFSISRSVVEAGKTGKGGTNELPWLLMIVLLLRGIIAGAKNNGTRCVSARTIPLTETDTCNTVECLPGMIMFRV